MPNIDINTLFSRYDSSQIYLLYDKNVPLSSVPGLSAITDSNRLALEVSEEKKNIEMVVDIWSFLMQHHATRHSLLLCVGGGITSDLGGFAASTYKRGIHYANIPTTLLSMVDASTGGKTGFNFMGVKNAVGTFAQPQATFIYPSLLATLPADQLLSGYAEILKTALLDSDAFLAEVINGFPRLADESLSFLSPLIERSLEVKRRIVDADPTEQGLRKMLNLGHTIGHGLEQAAIERKQCLPHGYAVMQGLVAELYLSVVACGFPRETLRQMSHLFVEYYGKVGYACTDYQHLLQLLHDDKKNTSPDAINFTLLRQVGEPLVNQTLPESTIRESLEYLFSL